MTPQFPYVKLPGSFRGFIRKASLWEGVDHILSVTGTRFSEDYRRFYYRDIQCFVVEKRPQAGSFGLWALLLFSLFIALSSLGSSSRDDFVFAGIAGLLLALLVKLYFSFARSCRCSIQTAVSREALPAIIRRSAAERVIARVGERIAAVQGDLPEEIPALENELLAAIRPPDPDARNAAEVLSEADLIQQKRSAIRGVNFAILGFFLLLANSVWMFWFSSPTKSFSQTAIFWTGYVFLGTEIISLFFSLQAISRIKTSRSLRLFGILVLIYLGLRFSFGISLTTAAPQISRTIGGASWAVAMRYYNNVDAGLALALAAIGLILIFAKWETFRRGGSSLS